MMERRSTFPSLVQHHQPMHLAGDPHALDLPGVYPAFSITVRMVSAAACHQSAGPCSAQPFFPWKHGIFPTLALEITFPILIEQHSLWPLVPNQFQLNIPFLTPFHTLLKGRYPQRLYSAGQCGDRVTCSPEART